jgi:branched-chain amino acid transport system ATP-binding protein
MLVQESPRVILLQTKKLTKAFGGLVAVRDVDFAVERGELRSIIGPNGAGKTTFFNLIAGALPPTRGRVIFKGEDITHLPRHKVVRRGIARSYQITNLFPGLSTFENVRAAAQARYTTFTFWGGDDAMRDACTEAADILGVLHLSEKAALPASALSHGDQRYLEIAVALAAKPELLFLDEPTAGMSPEETGKTMRLIRQLAGRVTIILVEHDMEVVMSISDRITVLHHGEVLAEGTPQEIRANNEVQCVYLGSRC